MTIEPDMLPPDWDLKPFDLPELPPRAQVEREPVIPSPTCPACESVMVSYEGIIDYGGDFGESICDTWHCLNCEHEWEANCVDIPDYDDDDWP